MRKNAIIMSLIALMVVVPTANAYLLDSDYRESSYVECNDKTAWRSEYNVENYTFGADEICPSSVGFINNYNGNITGMLYSNSSKLYRSVQVVNREGSNNAPPLNITISAWGNINSTNTSDTVALDEAVTVKYKKSTGNISLWIDGDKKASKNATISDIRNIEIIPENNTVQAGNVNITHSDWTGANFNNTGYAYGSGYTNNYIYYTITSLSVGVKDGNITYLSMDNETVEKGKYSDVVIEIPIPKVFDPMGIVMGAITLINLALTGLGLLYALIPDVMIESIDYISTSVYDLIELAIATAKTGAEWLLFIKNVGVARLKDLLTLGLIFLGLSYVKDLKKAFRGEKEYVEVFTDIFNDVLDKIGTLERITYRALDSVNNVASLFVLTFNMIVNIYHKIRDSIPFI